MNMNDWQMYVKHEEILPEINIEKEDDIELINNFLKTVGPLTLFDIPIIRPMKAIETPHFSKINTQINHPKEIKNILDKFIIGQEEAKRTISQAIFTHIKINKENASFNEQHTLLIGPSGSGKTELLRVIKRELGINMHILDVSSLSFAGYSANGGIHLKSFLENVKTGDIIVLDEFDKILFKNTNNIRDGDLLQSEFLKLLEGEKYLEKTNFSKNNSRNDVTNEKLNVDLSKCLFVLTGAFSDLLRSKKKTSKQHDRIGFMTENIEENQEKEEDAKLTETDLIQAGVLNELLGRLSFIEQLHELTEEDYLRIVKNEHSVYSKYRNTFLQQYNLDVKIDEKYLKELCKEMITSQLGVRGLNSKITKLFNNALFEMDINKNYNTIVIYKDKIKYSRRKKKNEIIIKEKESEIEEETALSIIKHKDNVQIETSFYKNCFKCLHYIRRTRNMSLKELLEDYVEAPRRLTRIFKDSGLNKFWFPVSKMPKNGGDWPLVKDMVANNHRLLVFTSMESKQASEGIAYQWNFMVENQCNSYSLI